MNEVKRLNIPRENFQEINENEKAVTSKRTLILPYAGEKGWSISFLLVQNFHITLNLSRISLFGAAHGWGGPKSPLPKLCHTYPTMINLVTVIPYLKRTASLPSPISIFSLEISKFCYIRKCRYKLHFAT